MATRMSARPTASRRTRIEGSEGTDSEDAIYPFNLADETGKPLDGDNNYIAFGKVRLNRRKPFPYIKAGPSH